MMEVAEALAIVLDQVKPLAASQTVLTPAVLGRVLARDAVADTDSPPFSKSLRDGYAVRAADCTPGVALRVVEEIAAGSLPSQSVQPGTCSRIFTGAAIPDGADAVVMQEDTIEIEPKRIQITDQSVKPRQWVFARGTEMRAGDVVLPVGTVLNSAALGVLASLGLPEANLYGQPRVNVLSTGSELIEPGEPLPLGKIRNSNGPMLCSQITQARGIANYLGIVRDDRTTTRDAIRAALDATDVLVIAGGVSVGTFDLVPEILGSLDVSISFRQVRMKPGKPMLFGTREKTLVFGLPGNPVSAFVCFELFVKPALQALAGYPNPEPRVSTLPLGERLSITTDRPTYFPARLEYRDDGVAIRPLPWEGAPDLCGLQPADAFLVLSPGDTRLDVGQPVSVILL